MKKELRYEEAFRWIIGNSNINKKSLIFEFPTTSFRFVENYGARRISWRLHRRKFSRQSAALADRSTRNGSIECLLVAVWWIYERAGEWVGGRVSE